jgi:hypothetical protein
MVPFIGQNDERRSWEAGSRWWRGGRWYSAIFVGELKVVARHFGSASRARQRVAHGAVAQFEHDPRLEETSGGPELGPKAKTKMG